jgi:uncharacterized membrane protein
VGLWIHQVWTPVAWVVHLGDVVLVLAGIGINLRGRWATCSAIALAIHSAVSLAMRAPHWVKGWNVWGTWEDVAETAAVGLGAVIAWRMLAGKDRGDGIGGTAQRLLGLCMVVFGISHYVYLNLTTPFVPKWLPPSVVFWAYATGAAHIAAGLAIISGLLARRAAQLATLMYALFGLIVWLPQVIKAPTSHDNWSETSVNWLLVGAAWCLADWLGRPARNA